MSRINESPTSTSTRARSGPRPAIRLVAAVLSAALAFSAIAPGLALASQADSEEEGSAPPGPLPGLEEGPEIETGEETKLEGLPGAAGGGEVGEEAPALESEPAEESELPPPPEPPAATAGAPSAPVEAPAGPDYAPAIESATQEAPSAPIENESLAAPESPRPAPQVQPKPVVEQAAPEAPRPVSPPEAPESGTALPPVVSDQGAVAAGSLAGQAVHIVRAGESLWSIAEALLPAGAGNAEIAAEVKRLWKLNAERIGTGDPSLVYAGTELRLR